MTRLSTTRAFLQALALLLCSAFCLLAPIGRASAQSGFYITASYNSTSSELDVVSEDMFDFSSVIYVDGEAITTYFASPSSIYGYYTGSSGYHTVSAGSPEDMSEAIQIYISNTSSPPIYISSITPTTVMQFDAGAVVTIGGENFTEETYLYVDGVLQNYNASTPSYIFLILTAANVASPGVLEFELDDIPSNSTAYTEITVLPAPPPVENSLQPSTAAVGSSNLKLTVNGSGFTQVSVIQWNGSPLATTYLSATQLSATLTAANLSKTGTYSVTVNTPTIGTSAPLTFSIAPSSPPPDLGAHGGGKASPAPSGGGTSHAP